MSERPLPVYLSQNRVVLTEGHGGTLPNRFISRVCVMVRGQEVEVESRAGALPSPQSVDEAWRHLGSRRSAPRRPRSSAASKSWLSALPLPASFASLWFFVLPLQSLSYSEAGMLSRKSTKAAFSARPLGVPSSLRPSLITLCLPYRGSGRYFTDPTPDVSPGNSADGNALGHSFAVLRSSYACLGPVSSDVSAVFCPGCAPG